MEKFYLATPAKPLHKTCGGICGLAPIFHQLEMRSPVHICI